MKFTYLPFCVSTLPVESVIYLFCLILTFLELEGLGIHGMTGMTEMHREFQIKGIEFIGYPELSHDSFQLEGL